MAVVNDLPVMVGSHVDSAVVTEIVQTGCSLRLTVKFTCAGAATVTASGHVQHIFLNH